MRSSKIIAATTTVLAFLLASFLTAPGAADPPPWAQANGFVVEEEVYNDQGVLVAQYGHMDYDQDLRFAREWTHQPNHNPGGGGGGGGGGGTDCTSTKYRLAPWVWTSPYTATASSFASTFNSAGNTWDAATGGAIFGGISSGSSATAGQQDFVNQIDFVGLGAGGTIAVTTTWYFRGSNEAVESDAQYNTFYPWSTSGAANAMDVAAIGTHELGHTFGLDHPSGPSSQISCLTMYAYADYGQTHQRTLGDGDILGIRDIYGA